MHDKSTAEINVTAEKIALQLDKEAELKALLNGTEAKIDLYQKSTSRDRRRCAKCFISHLQQQSSCSKKYTVKNLQLLAEGYTKTV